MSSSLNRPVAFQYVESLARAERQSGPWGEALRYWLDKKNLSQADLVRLIHKREQALARQVAGPRGKPKRLMNPNTISRVGRGLHTQTSVLARIADALGVPLPDLLVSPARFEERQRLAEQITARVMHELSAAERGQSPTADTVATEFARQAEELEAAEQKRDDAKADTERIGSSRKKR